MALGLLQEEVSRQDPEGPERVNFCVTITQPRFCFVLLRFALGIVNESQELGRRTILFLDCLVTEPSHCGSADAPIAVLVTVFGKHTLPTVPLAPTGPPICSFLVLKYPELKSCHFNSFKM